jgi:CheY-like chemotaxis protein
VTQAHILVAEDDPDAMKTISSLLTFKGHHVIGAKDAHEAASVFRANTNINIILSDYSMGGGSKDGDALFIALRDELAARKCKFVMTSDLVTGERRAYLEKNGVQIILKFKLYREFQKILGLP